MDWTIVVVVIQLVFLEGILSIDNAAVLGAMVAHLPDDQEIVWPESLRKFGHRLSPILGTQRMAALRVGLLGAYVGRGLMLLLASIIVQNPWLKVLGAAYLVRLAFDNLGMAEENENDAHIHPIETNTFWAIVLTVEMTDLVFSVDNVVAAVALSNKLWVVLLGVAIGILMMRFAAGFFSYAVRREPVLKTTAYILVLAIGAELLLEEFAHIDFSDWMRFSISVSIILLSLVYAHSQFLQKFRPVLVWIAQGFANFNEVIDWALVPFFALFGLLKVLFARPEPKAEVEVVLPVREDAQG